MTSHLLDTSIYSQPLKRNPVLAALERWDAVGDALCATSRACVAEVEAGLRAENRPTRLAKYDQLLRPRIQVLPLDEAVWQSFTALKAHQYRVGYAVADLDLLIAATAVRHDLILATLNVRHFAKIESLRWEDWSIL